MTGEAAERLSERFLAEPGVTTGFGTSRGLRVGGKIFAIFGDGGLTLKLPKQRVDELVDAGQGERFAPRRDGRVMKEWVTVDARHEDEWEALASEALEFVRG